MLKEEGYEAFLADKIRKSETEFAEGKYLTLGQSKVSALAVIEELERDMQAFELGSQYA